MPMTEDGTLPPATDAVDLARYRARRALQRRLALLAELEGAIGRRDSTAMWDIIDEPAMERGLPREVREEAIVIAHLPADVHRAPVHLYRHQHALAQLGDEPFIVPAGDDDGRDTSRDAPAPRAIDFPRAPTLGPGAGRRGTGAR